MRLKHMSMLVVMTCLSGVAMAEQPMIIDGNGNLKMVQPQPKNAESSPPTLNQIPAKGPSGPAPANPMPPSEHLAPSETPVTVNPPPSMSPKGINQPQMNQTKPMDTTTEDASPPSSNNLTSDHLSPVPSQPPVMPENNNAINQN